MFSVAETDACRRLIEMALAEDLGSVGDITSQAVIPERQAGQAVFVARVPGVLAGWPAAAIVIAAVEPRLLIQPLITDATRMQPGDQIARVTGPMRGILAAERTALNFLQHLSGIATLTRRYVDAVAGLKSTIFDTRKTLPGWRLLEKYAVRCGGGFNHRMGLFDGVLIKDNHLGAVLRSARCPVVAAIDDARKYLADALPIEIEVDSLDQLADALFADADIILLDNMSADNLREAVARRDRHRAESGKHAFLEASGGITLANVRAIAETGVDRISVGALTHSAPALDIALDYLA
jgi:nicotinate-nucleotide pyrophosphorylase (carboxylating)